MVLNKYRKPLKDHGGGPEATGEDIGAWREDSIYIETGMVLCQITPIKFPIIITNDRWEATTDLAERCAMSISFATSKTAPS